MAKQNAKLRAMRERTPSRTAPGEPMSRTELAESVNAFLWNSTAERYDLDGHAIARYERGQVAWPSAHYRSGLRAVLGVSTDSELGFHPSPRGSTTMAATRHDKVLASDSEDAAETFAALGYGAFPAESSALQQAEQLRLGVHEVLAEGALSEASLDEWDLTVVRHGMATRDRPAAALLVDLSADFGELERAMNRCRSVSTLRRLTRVTAHMSGLMCLTLVKLDERPAFRRWARTARVAALEIDDPVTHAWVLAQEAYGHFYSDDLPEAVHVARHAQAVVPNTACVGSVLAAALEARALAALGRAEPTYAALHRAESILAILDESAVVASAFGYNEAQLRFHESNALTHLGDTKAAWTAQERALTLVPASDFMDRAFTQLDRAVCIARDGDAAGASGQALDTLLGLTKAQRAGIITSRARQLVAALPPQRQALRPVRELRDVLALPTNPEG